MCIRDRYQRRVHGVVTKPFPYEGKVRTENAELGLKNLKGFVDTLLVIPNNKILETFPTIGVVEGFRESDMIIYNGVKSLSDIITKTGYINVEFSDIKTIMRNMGYCLIGSGEAEGEDRAITVSYTHLTLPTILLVQISVVAVSLKKKNKQQSNTYESNTTH
eukprot:TRINITY_DN39783_c0_g1_i3.p2 TRINITY_DN39783_c0_g1~~TRINITY_DN39783_c0_g1_i3.p2  ORF type:complete len:162 (-),score=37.65 TRINITY_DN39783_c0_g1_i3:41-526(-)